MIWKKITIETTNDSADIVSSVLFDNGICGVEIDDTLNFSDDDLKSMHVDKPIEKNDTGIAFVSFYISISENHFENNTKIPVVTDYADNSYIASADNIFSIDEYNDVMKNIITSLDEYKDFTDMGTLKTSETLLDDTTFLNKWKENFKKIDINNISIIPSWEKENYVGDKTYIYIEPGSAFGTGQHVTTKLCVKSIDDIVRKNNFNSLIDIGCGSGLLAILGKKLGIKDVMAIDIDSNIKDNLVENILLNFTDRTFSINNKINDKDIAESKKYIDFDFGNIIDNLGFYNKIKSKTYDIVVANILSPVIISLIKTVKIDEFVNKNGYFICSGIIAEMKENVLKEIENTEKFTSISVENDDDWVCITCKKS